MLSTPGWRERSLKFFLVGAVAGGALTFTVAGLIAVASALVDMSIRIGAWGLITTVIGIVGITRFSHKLPQRRRLVPQYAALRGPAVGAFQFGLEMGTGLRTYVTATAPYVLAVGVLLLGGPIVGMLAGIGFGLGRSLMAASTFYSSGVHAWILAFHRNEAWIDLAAFMCTSVLIALAVGMR